MMYRIFCGSCLIALLLAVACINFKDAAQGLSLFVAMFYCVALLAKHYDSGKGRP